MIGRIYREMLKTIDPSTALAIIRRTIENAAYEEGRAFREENGGEATMEHFRTVLDRWGDAMEIADREASSCRLRFNVIGCHYIRFYEQLGLPPELVRLLSCGRDAPFASGYGVDFQRTQTLATGGHHCDFLYEPKPGDG